MREFFGCYLLKSQHPLARGRTYIGFTVNPRRRIRQHNGHLTCGAKQTRKYRPWEMTLVLYGFPTQVQALQFEWAWQHPLKSKLVRAAATQLGKAKMMGLKGKVLLLHEMLHLSPWKMYPLTLQFLAPGFALLAKGAKAPPPHIQVLVAPPEQLPDCLYDDDEAEINRSREAAVPDGATDGSSSDGSGSSSSEVDEDPEPSSQQQSGSQQVKPKRAAAAKRTAPSQPLQQEPISLSQLALTQGKRASTKVAKAHAPQACLAEEAVSRSQLEPSQGQKPLTATRARKPAAARPASQTELSGSSSSSDDADPARRGGIPAQPASLAAACRQGEGCAASEAALLAVRAAGGAAGAAVRALRLPVPPPVPRRHLAPATGHRCIGLRRVRPGCRTPGWRRG
ncbi:MAG: hypothetical protein WDW36_007769 [Sanguina aurantia]